LVSSETHVEQCLHQFRVLLLLRRHGRWPWHILLRLLLLLLLLLRRTVLQYCVVGDLEL
jgi:hypothetical protein